MGPLIPTNYWCADTRRSITALCVLGQTMSIRIIDYVMIHLLIVTQRISSISLPLMHELND